jgi:hypothetical protein
VLLSSSLFPVSFQSLLFLHLHTCLAAICVIADVHDVYELMRALSLIKVRKQYSVLMCSVKCDVY